MESLIGFFSLTLPTHLVKVLTRGVSVVLGVLDHVGMEQMLDGLLGRHLARVLLGRLQ